MASEKNVSAFSGQITNSKTEGTTPSQNNLHGCQSVSMCESKVELR